MERKVTAVLFRELGDGGAAGGLSCGPTPKLLALLCVFRNGEYGEIRNCNKILIHVKKKRQTTNSKCIFGVKGC